MSQKRNCRVQWKNVSDEFKQRGKKKERGEEERREEEERRPGKKRSGDERRGIFFSDELVSPLSTARLLIYESANLRVFGLASLPTPSMTAE